MAKNQKKVKKKASSPATIVSKAAIVAPAPPKYKASFYSSPKQVEPDFAEKVLELEKELKKRVVLLWHGNSKDNYSNLDSSNYLMFARNIRQLKDNEPIAVLICSPGGSGGAAFKLASLLRKHCGGFTAIIPYYAKSAASLFSLGADKIIMSKFAELGPLDVQIWDGEKEERFSALEVVQAIERLNNESMRAVDQQMLFWLRRSRKKVDTLLPLVSHFVSEMMQPLFDKIDTVYYTGMARNLKVAQDYAQRLLEKCGVKPDDAKEIADKLTNSYSEHGYIVDCDELKRIGLSNIEEAKGKIADIIEDMAFMGPQSTMLGPLEVI